ncbi:4'-phosphopantetheinyl transferase family protein [Jiulongibacter sediminis]|uniref:4'-phosphopantetheinyl transferase family protein n=1 Tax=Jiulongibacter sediminis TaxID=1605367 RepID=UPI0006DCC2C0|nr:4'-phosphopantetheinyl transferase superfamily protein [Jiulongibacter sediminis]
MPVRFQKKCDSGAHLLVWEAKEDAEELFASLPSTILTDAEYLTAKTEQKKLELLCSRVAIRHLAAELGIDFEGIKKDEHGKPYMVGTHWEMSITHSKKFMAVVMHPTKPVGVDIERPQEKMWRITERLYSPAEIEAIGDDLNTMSIYWSAKEALYKLYGRRGTDFKENLKVFKEGNQLKGEIIMPDHQQVHDIHVEPVGSYFLVWAI